MLLAENLFIERQGKLVLDDVSLSLSAGEVVGVLGANGAGKSTLLAMLAGELAPQRGRVSVDGTPLDRLDNAHLARQRAVLPQSPSLSFNLGVCEVVAMGAYPFPELSTFDVEQLMIRALALADVSHLAGRRYPQLSGGEAQRVQFARVLVQVLAARQSRGGRFLLLDEPTASLDPKHQQALLACARQLARDERIGVLVILHDVNLAAAWCDRLALLAQGKLVGCGDPASVLTPATLAAVYGVEAEVIPHPRDSNRPLVLFN
ncbi:heme ABC transporter ATP-binding protein [Jeongeupia chitinilytica]|uniref:Hemin import ATP-binding protein HmuV n=1 Tax=Jeongeupia chitinilytica TaxID=1041641 RepID=A0ABQ3GXM7_9NEIS|nr:heme ABC transporter ATP-binding protein [Jeongeupia chitinilytica]GHD58674.1 hemin import ATP-binding protein HmuV [Jeongeupia chitinilytica]